MQLSDDDDDEDDGCRPLSEEKMAHICQENKAIDFDVLMNEVYAGAKQDVVIRGDAKRDDEAKRSIIDVAGIPRPVVFYISPHELQRSACCVCRPTRYMGSRDECDLRSIPDSSPGELAPDCH